MAGPAPDSDLDALARSLAELRARVAPLLLRRHERRRADATAAERLTVPQHLALLALAGGPLAISELAARTGVAVSTATRMAQGLGREGWVERVAGDGDRRRRPVRLTAAGRAVMEEASAVTERRYRELLAALGPGDRADLVAGVAALLKAVQADESRRSASASAAASSAASSSPGEGAATGSGDAPAGRMPSRITAM
ncbi:MarR family winged helix-turn-helix transcriptional regulator [Miltoncostaea marina]|uniref:MarR family winged helix-turn-helix transcriptional regulator n=1 Tax=Miltoncostaea marina TaxID=2843215 RepID=UPI0031BB392E